MSAAATCTAAAEAAARIERWLLDGPARQRDGAERGAVAGSVEESGKITYVYGEVTGYYLAWLATRRDQDLPRVAPHARAALQWIEKRYTGSDLPPTRVYLGPDPGDWRNRAQFCFDLSMLVGGLVRAAQRGLIDPAREVIGKLCQHLAALQDGDGLIPYQVRSPGPLVPGWSTSRGPYLVKAAARLLSAEPLVPLPPALRHACHAHLQRHPPAAEQALVNPVHPTLYHLEGLLALKPDALAGAAAVLSVILNQSAPDGSLPESQQASQVRRSDIIAQALRLGVLLVHQGFGRALEPVLDRLAAQLAQRVRSDGALPFVPEATPLALNVWSAMFAEQALTWYAAWRGGRALGMSPLSIV